MTLLPSQSSPPLFDNYALEITGKDIAQLERCQAAIPEGTPINIAFLGNETHDQRVNAARIIRDSGWEPVPIISSRRLKSTEDRDALLSQLLSAAAPKRFILVGGDPSTPAGPYRDSIDLLNSNILADFGIRNVGIVAYPEGHPKIEDDRLWAAFEHKISFLKERGCAVEITTQFGFDPDAIVAWIERIRLAGVLAPVRIGAPGPASVTTLLRFARQFGVLSSAKVVGRYGFSLGDLASKATADRFMTRLLAGLETVQAGAVGLHIYPFGGIAAAVDWIEAYERCQRGESA